MSMHAAAPIALPWSRLQSEFEAAQSADREVLRTGAGVTLRPWMEHLLATPGAAATVPSLHAVSADSLPDGTLVRFCGMVQDVQDPEYYDGVYEEVDPSGAVRLCTTMYQGFVASSAGREVRPRHEFVWQRTPVACMPIPSRAAWLDAALAGPAAAAAASVTTPPGASTRSKRSAEESTDDDMQEEAVGPPSADETVAVSKRTRAPTEPSADPTPGLPSNTCAVCDGANGGGTWARAAAAGSVLLKVYEQAEGEADLKVHELVEIYGLLERAPEDISLDDEDELMPMVVEAVAERRQRPPPSAQPRLHVIMVRRMVDLHEAVLPPPASAEEALALRGMTEHVRTLRSALLGLLVASLGGDELAAEYALLAVSSRVIGHHGDAPIGKLHLNITGCPPASEGASRSPLASSLHTALSEVLPLCAVQSCALQALNAASIAPRKDHDANCIWPAPLQLPSGATVLLDEVMMQPGQLNACGTTNLSVLRSVLEVQKLPYDFVYCSVDFGIDMSLISLSLAKSVLPHDCVLPLKVAPLSEASSADLSPQVKQAARVYLGLVARMQSRFSSMGEDVSKRAQEDFVNARQVNPKVTADDFGRLLTCTRLVAAAALSTSADSTHYEHAQRLEQARLARLSSREVPI